MDQALQHPWITRDFEAVIPRNHFEQNMYLNELDDKFRKVFSIIFTLSIVKNHQEVKEKHSKKHLIAKNSPNKTQLAVTKKAEEEGIDR